MLPLKAELPSGLIKKIKSLLNIKNKDNMCFAYCIAAYLLRREAAARRARELGLTATQAAPTPSDQPAIPPELVGLAEAVTQQLQYNAAVAANPDAASYLAPPPIWPPPKPSIAPPTDLEGPEEPGFSDETEATTVLRMMELSTLNPMPETHLAPPMATCTSPTLTKFISLDLASIKSNIQSTR